MSLSQTFLVLNAGSSSLKFTLYHARDLSLIAEGMADRIGSDAADLVIKDPQGQPLCAKSGALDSHAQAIALALDSLREIFPNLNVRAVGHRVVHGGIEYGGPAIITPKVLADLESLSPFAPLHQPHNIAGIRAAQTAFPDALQLACFDTAFHRTHPWVNDTFALPRKYYDMGVRRYGFHGLSYEFISTDLAQRAPALAAGRVVVAHLGNGASMCAIQNGRSVASTMGFTVLDGLPMGTRSGQVDPGVLLYLMEQERMTPAEISRLLYRESGLLGLSGISNDMRTLEQSDSPAARQAIEYFVFRIQRELGAMAAAMGGIDALIFCGGIGENSRLVRARVCERTEWMGIEMDHARNAENAMIISTDLSRAKVMVIPTNESLVIARAIAAVI